MGTRVEHAAGQDRQWANPILEKVAPPKYRSGGSKQTNGRSVSQSCMYVAATTVDVHLHLAAAATKDCIRGWLAEQADEWLWAGSPVHSRSSCARLRGA